MKANRKYKWLLFLLAAPFCFWGSWVGLERWHYATSDEISRSGIDTERILQRYQSTDDVSEILNWILHGPTEAPGAQMCMVLARWAVEHQNQFVAILESLPLKERERFIDHFSDSLNQSSPQQFEAAFANNSSISIQRILKRGRGL